MLSIKRFHDMRKFLRCENGFIERPGWFPHSWVNIECPDKDDYDFLVGDLRVPPDFLESVSDNDERPRIERSGDWKLTILRIPHKTDGGNIPYITVPIGIITNNEIIVTVCYHFTELIPDFIAHSRIRGIEINNEPDFILRIIYSSSFWYLKYLREINNTVSEMEKSLEKSVKNEELLSMMHIQKTLVLFNTSITGNESLIQRIRRVYGDRYDRDLLEDVEIELTQADNTVKVYSDILEGTMDTFASIISNNVNAIMKKMTGVSIVLMIPTLIASFYGMNVAIGYESLPWVFYVIVGGSMLLSAMLYIWLRRIDWF